MIRITPYKIPSYSRKSSDDKGHVSFSSNQIGVSKFSPVNLSLLKTQDSSLSWVKDANLLSSLDSLAHLNFDEKDVKYVQSMGVVLPFLSGQEAVKFIKDSNIRVKFATLPTVNTHAQYDFENNDILINDLYKDTNNPAEILAISEAILHEAGHAKDKDGASTVQEEIECLSLNALSHRALSKKHPNIFENQNSLIIKDGVCVYADLFFDEDPSKVRLVKRLQQKYGQLPAGDFKHPPTGLAYRVKNS